MASQNQFRLLRLVKLTNWLVLELPPFNLARHLVNCIVGWSKNGNILTRLAYLAKSGQDLEVGKV